MVTVPVVRSLRSRVPSVAAAARGLIGLAVSATVVVLAVLHRDTLRAGWDSLMSAQGQWWLTLAAIATAAIWVAGAVTQLGAMVEHPPVRRLVAVQIAASFASHLLPAGSGGILVNLRFLQRHGMSRRTAVRAVGLNSLAGLLSHVALLIAALLVAPSAVADVGTELRHRGIHLPGGARVWELGVAGALLVAVILFVRAHGHRGRRVANRAGAVLEQLRTETRELRAVLSSPGRALKLWVGSLATPLLHALILLAVLRAISVTTPAATVVVAYLVASSLAALVPSPGGMGALDVALVAGFVAVGIDAPAALAAVLAYRLYTVWVPLLPGAAVFAVLARRRII